jgi:hypothetical protein
MAFAWKPEEISLRLRTLGEAEQKWSGVGQPHAQLPTTWSILPWAIGLGPNMPLFLLLLAETLLRHALFVTS